MLPPWEALLKEEEVHQYVDHLRESKADGVDGILTQLDHLDAALEFITPHSSRVIASFPGHRSKGLGMRPAG